VCKNLLTLLTLRFAVNLHTFVVYLCKHVQIHSVWYYKWCLLGVSCRTDDRFPRMTSKCTVLYWLNKIYSSLFIFAVRLGFYSTVLWPDILLDPYFRIIGLLLFMCIMLIWRYWLLSFREQEMQGMVKVLDKCFTKFETTCLYSGVCWSGFTWLWQLVPKSQKQKPTLSIQTYNGLSTGNNFISFSSM
jgi:hypothetical protein